MKSVSLHTLGCKLNYSETSTIGKGFSQKGFSLKEFGEPADVFVLNTCSVTENADRECRQIVRSVLNKNPQTYVIVTGCYAQLQPNEIASIEGVDLVLGISEKMKLMDYIDNIEKKELSCIHRDSVEKANDFFEAFSSDTDSRTRAFLKIQDGCNYKCSFCTIPLARGASRSLAPDKVLDNAKKIIDAGYREIVLTGVNTGDYDFENYRLIDILNILEGTEIDRIRLSSIEPNLITDEIISFAKNSEKFCNHMHIPMQSGDNEILRSMRRRYNREYYRDTVLKLKDEVKDICIGADVIVGYPGETEEHFLNTEKFIRELPVNYLHVFSYSERRDTDAVLLPGRVEIADRKKRSSILRRLSDSKKYEHYNKFIGTEQTVLFESDKDDYAEGLSENYIRVKVNKSNLENKIRKVKLTETDGIKPVTAELLS
ncbi:MAG TPA: tRNA (N(6)-L-threonylcarbamoyladenosine(37)-C(2))-methylthiotransferase MtaB [Ignavibacteria bacterium]|nr:tRNA (N(6)-L-threonylcarbamoyladenosine(37)-C(2))-methylthiotransferase MtaB [Ignavibacteria bacterium]HRB00549.1 tRNA (N(6)-L-threonylcarbamoyladenosine(37)-C(2))-methylthiotransferase MtaB [Ignavibacteria bacterium]